MQTNNGRRRRLNIARTVCEIWNGAPFENALALLRDDIKSNNTPDNLYWGTYLDNVNDRRNHGNGQDGENNINAKITWESVRAIRDRYREGLNIPKIAEEFGITGSHCANIIANRLWKE